MTDLDRYCARRASRPDLYDTMHRHLGRVTRALDAACAGTTRVTTTQRAIAGAFDVAMHYRRLYK